METNVRNALNTLASRANNSLPQSVVNTLNPLKVPGYDPGNRNTNKFIPAYKDQTDYSILYRLQDKRFKTRDDLDRFQKLFMRGGRTLSQDIRNLEHKWYKVYLEPIIEFMGDRDLWHALGIYVPDTNIHSAKSALARLPPSQEHIAYFSGVHWISRRAGTSVVFDPYDEYQIYGSNQFCQTFSMMYLIIGDDMGVGLQRNTNWLKYYTYTKCALDFIENLIARCKRTPRLKNLPTFKNWPSTTLKNLEAAIKVCQKHPNMCLNVPALPDSKGSLT